MERKDEWDVWEEWKAQRFGHFVDEDIVEGFTEMSFELADRLLETQTGILEAHSINEIWNWSNEIYF